MCNITPVGQLCVFRFKLTKTLFNVYLNNNYDNYIYVLQKLVAHNVKRRWCQYNRLCLLYCPTKCYTHTIYTKDYTCYVYMFQITCITLCVNSMCNITPVGQLCVFRFKLTKTLFNVYLNNNYDNYIYV